MCRRRKPAVERKVPREREHRCGLPFYLAARLCDLSVQEARFVTHLRSGLTPQEVAARMLISRHTGDTYARRAKRRLGASTIAQLIADLCEKQPTA